MSTGQPDTLSACSPEKSGSQCLMRRKAVISLAGTVPETAIRVKPQSSRARSVEAEMGDMPYCTPQRNGDYDRMRSGIEWRGVSGFRDWDPWRPIAWAAPLFPDGAGNTVRAGV